MGCTSTFSFLLAAPVEPAFSLSAMIYHGGDGPTGGLVGRYVPFLAAADCSDSCLHIFVSINGAPVKNACMYRDGTGQTRIDNQLTLLWSAESCYTVTSFYCFSSGVSTCAQPAFRCLS